MTYKIDAFIEKISCPVVCVTEKERIEFENGKKAADYSFDENYIVESVDVQGNKIIVNLVINKDLGDVSWADAKQVSLFDGS